MSNEVTDNTTADQMSDTPMDSPEKLEKGKGKMPVLAAHDGMDDDEDSSEDDTEAEGEAEEGDGDAEEADEDNMEEIDLDNIVGSRTRGKNIDYAEAAKNLAEDDEDDEEDDDFVDPDDKMMED